MPEYEHVATNFIWRGGADEPNERLAPFIGNSFIIPITSLLTEHYNLLQKLELYIENHPPFTRMDAEDPNKDKPRIAIGVAGLIVKRGANSLFGDGKFFGAESFALSDPKFKEWFRRWWTETSMDTEILDAAFMCIGYADNYWKLYYEANINKENGNSEPGAIKIQTIDPLFVIPVYSPNNTDDIYGYIIQYRNLDGTWFREEIDIVKSIIYRGIEGVEDEDNTFIPVTEMEAQPFTSSFVRFEIESIVDHNLGFLPIVHIKDRVKKGSPYGDPILEGVLDKIDALNWTMSDALWANMNQADPILWASGVKKGDPLQRGADRVWYLESPEAALHVLTWEGLPQTTFELAKSLIASIYSETMTLNTEEVKAASIAFDTLRILFTDVIDELSRRRKVWQDAFRTLVWKLAVIAVKKGLVSDFDVKEEDRYALVKYIRWGPVVASDKSAFLDMLLIQVEKRLLAPEDAILLLGTMPDYEDAIERIKVVWGKEPWLDLGSDVTYGGMVGKDKANPDRQESVGGHKNVALGEDTTQPPSASRKKPS